MTKRSKILHLMALGMMSLMLMASCAKIETNEIQSPEIYYQMPKSPSTKAERQALDPSNKFISWAYNLPTDQNWDTKKASAIPYVDEATIHYVDGVWKDQFYTNYWPLTGRLTFFSWTDNSAAPAINSPAVLSCNHDGIHIANYDIDNNRNKDILVSDIAMNQTSNAALNGVPTIFKHILSSFAFKIQRSENAGSETYRLQSIVFTNIKKAGQYDQVNTPVWSNLGNSETVSLFTGDMAVTDDLTVVVPSNTDFSILIPQYIADPASKPQIRINYTVNGNPRSREYDLNLAYSKNFFEPGKQYVLSISLGLQEVFWAPGIKEWVNTEYPWYV